MPNWTPEQENAINIRNSNVLISAAAGSGKTAVLVERVIQKITDNINPVDIDKLLIVTFTNAASSEMKSRISKALNKKLKDYPNDTNLIKQLSLMPNAKICTIDSFCISLAREYFYHIDIEQDFNILDDAQNLLVEDNALNTIIDEFYEYDNADFKHLVELLSNPKNDKSFVTSIKKINNYINVQPFPLEWFNSVCELYNPNTEIEDTIWGKYILDQANSILSNIYDLIDMSLNEITESDDLHDELIALVNDDKSQFDKIRDAKTWNELCNATQNIAFARMTSKKATYTSKPIISANRDVYKDLFNKEIKPLFSATADEYISDCEKLYPNVKMLFEVVKKYNEEIMRVKKELNSYTFSDIEHFAINLLVNNQNGVLLKTDLAKEFESAFDEILVDEYQDTNTTQDTLYYMLSNGHNLFMVGDVKQSIYRFRHAMPKIFTEKKNSFDNYNVIDSINRKILLSKNFRSRKEICDYVNHIFSSFMSKEIGELDYNKDEYLFNGADYNESNIPSAQINILTSPEDMDADEYEAHHVAKLILNKINSKELIKDDDEYRPIRFGDFAILFRAASTRMPIFNKILSEYGIPVVSNNKLNLFDSNEIVILLSLLRVIDNPTSDIPLLATLMSVFYGYNADQISFAKINYKSNNLYASISQDETFSKFNNDLEKYRKYASSMSVEAFIRNIINETSYLAIISSMGNGEQRKLNVMKLLDIAKRFDNGNNIGLASFIRYIDSVIDAGVSIESADNNSTNDNAVSLMTIHKSKGLEFPVCILAGSSHRYNNDDLSSLIQLNSDFGLGLKIYNEDQFYRYNSIQYNCIKDMNTISSQSENLRVLYVALTRAKEQFITFFTNKNPQKHINTLATKIISSKVLPSVVKRISCDGDFLLLGALLHKDGKELRELVDNDIIPNPLFTYDLSINFIDDKINKSLVEAENAVPSLDMVEEIKNKLSFEYKTSSLSSYSSKRTASSLDEKEQNYKYFASSKPAFLNKSGMTAAQKGTAMHSFMQYCDYKNAKDDLEDEIERLVLNSFITKEQADNLDKTKLNNLFNSDFALRMFNSDKIYREIKVSSFVPVNELEETDFNDNVLIQGIADCVFEENNELVLVDYKTDRVENEDELLDRYKNQIAFYKKAISKTLKKPVKEALLYSFSLNKVCIYK